MNTKKFFIYVFTAAALLLCGCGRKSESSVPAAAGSFEFSVLKVGKADAAVMQTQNGCVVIDCGEKTDGKKVLEFLAQRGIGRIDYLVITHFDKDHVGGAAKVIDGVEVSRIIVPDYKGTNDEYESFCAAAKAHGITPCALTQNESFILDDVLFNIYPPQSRSYETGDNDFSLVIDISHGENRMLFMGDAEAERTAEVLKTINGKFEFLKVPHHGRYNSETENLIKSVMPAYSVITDSDKNPADKAVTDALKSCGSKVYFTKDGTVSVLSNGKDLKISQ